MIRPHGGALVDRTAKGKAKDSLKEKAGRLDKIRLSDDRVQEIANIATGVFSPLEGFMDKRQLLSVLDTKRLPGGAAWTIPIVLDIDSSMYNNIKKSESVALTDGKDDIVAVMEIEDVYEYDKAEFAEKVYNTFDSAHPGVAGVMGMGDRLLGGKITLVEMPEHEFSEYTLTPARTRERFASFGWDTVVAFQTRNVPHVGHEYVQKTALSYVDGLFINPVIGRKKKGDFKDEVILDSYKALIDNYYHKGHVFMAVLQMQMRYAGPREAIHHAIIRKNFGCTHIIIGRDHAGVGKYYHPFTAHEIFKEFPDLEIQPIFFRSFFWCNKCGGVANDKTCGHGKEYIEDFSGTDMRAMVEKGMVPSPKMMRPEVAACIIKHKNPFVE